MKLKMKSSVDMNEHKNKNKKFFIPFLVLVLALFAIGAFVIFLEKDTDTSGEEYFSSESNVETEDTESVVDEEYLKQAKQEVKQITSKVDEILGDKACYYGIYYYDINSGLQYMLNEDETFEAASTIKVTIGMMISDLLYSNKLNLKSTITYEESDYEEGTGSLQGEVEVGDKIRIDKLLNHMIEESDNIATNMLKKEIGSIPEYVSKVTGINMEDDTNIVTAQQMGIMLKLLNEKVDENVYYKYIIKLMSNTTTHDRLDKYIPQDIVAHKIGDYEYCINDIGIIYTDNPYILCVYTKNVMEEGRENIALISKAIYDIKTNNE